jgi:IS605 OrfB family transposase
MAEKGLTLTYQTRVEVSTDDDATLQECGELLSRVKRSLFARMMKGEQAASLKSSFLRQFGITARHFNACRVAIEGKIESIRQLNMQYIQHLGDILGRLKKTISRLKKKKDKRKLHGKQIRYCRLSHKKERLEKDKKEGKIRLCFGSRKLFRKQFNEDVAHDAWKEEWDFRRSREFFMLGSKDEASGNQTCTAVIQDDGALTLRIRLPDALGKEKYLVIRDVSFSYGHERILEALERCYERKRLLQMKDSRYKEEGTAISYRLVRDEKGWRVFVSLSLPPPQWESERRRGVIGIDVNVDHVALVETDRNGNPVHKESIPMNLYGCDKNQSLAVIGEVCAHIVRRAVSVKKPIIVEALDFRKKKSSLREMDSQRARLLSSFAYSSLLQALRSRAYRNRIEYFSVDPAFTSLIGRIKYAKRYGLTIHEAAALCIGRRFQGFSERLPSRTSVPDGKGSHIVFSVPVRNQKKTKWHYLKEVAKKLQTALAEHFRVTRSQSTDPPYSEKCDVKSSRIVGEIPARESLAVLFG